MFNPGLIYPLETYNHCTAGYETSSLYQEGGNISQEFFYRHRLVCLCVCTEVLQHLQLQLMESERRNADYVQRFQKMQADYCNLTETTAELVDALEATISGKTVGFSVSTRCHYTCRTNCPSFLYSYTRSYIICVSKLWACCAFTDLS